MPISGKIKREPFKKRAKKKPNGEGLNPNVLKLGIAGILLLLVLIIFGWRLGWFGGDGGDGGPGTPTAGTQPLDPASSPPPPPDPASAVPAPEGVPTDPDGAPPMPQTAYDTPNPTSEQPAMPSTSPYGEDTMTPEKPPLPENYKEWKKEDYQRAREEKHPKLPEAVAFLGAHAKFKGNTPVAQGLANLLKAPKPPQASSDQPYEHYQGHSSAQPGLIEAIVFALGNNGSETAQQTILDIIAGKFTTENDRSAMEAALKVLVVYPSPRYEEVLLKILTQPEEIRPEDPQAAFNPQELRRRVLELAKPRASEQLRLKLAQQLPLVPYEPNNPLVDFLLQEDPLNLKAQLVLHQGEDIVEDAKSRLEQYFLNYGSMATRLALGVPEKVETSGGMAGMNPDSYPSAHHYDAERPYPTYSGMESSPYDASGSVPGLPLPPKPTEEELGVRLAQQIWTGSVAASLAEQLDNVRGLDRQPQTILLAATIPTDPFRAAILEILKKRPLDGPQPLEAAGLADRVVTDPGFLVVAKMLPRKDPQSIRGGRGGPRPGYNDYNPDTPGPGGRVDPRRQREHVQMAWFDASQKLVGLWCARFEAAALEQKRAARRGKSFGEPPPEKPDDVELPAGADVKAAFQVNWPEKAPQDIQAAKPSPLRVQFFRLETYGQLKKTMAVLRRGIRRSKLRQLENGIWLDALNTDSERNTKRSIDVVITRADENPFDYTQRREETDLVIDILTIEINDPGGSKKSTKTKEEKGR